MDLKEAEPNDHCTKCKGPCSIHIFRRYASYTATETSDMEADEQLFQARADYVTHHWNEGKAVECKDPNCQFKNSTPKLSRTRSPVEESHYIFCHSLPQLSVSKPKLSRQNSNRFLCVSPNNFDRSLGPKQLLKKTKSVRYQKLLVEQVRQRQSVQSEVLVFGVQFICSKTEAKWNNPKEEVLKNEFIKTSIENKEWNTLLRSCKKYARTRNAKKIRLTIKDVIGFKLYTDFDELQKEFRKCFRSQDLDRQSQFYWWNNLLEKACRKSNDYISGNLYHGVSKLTRTSTFNGTYYGPVSTTTSYDTAKQFSGDSGRILELHSSYGRPGMQLSWLSNYPDECEVMFMNISLSITNIYHPQHDKSALRKTSHDLQAIAKKYGDSSDEKLDEEALNHWKEIQQNAESAMKKISRAANIISLNHSIDKNSCDFSKLACKEKVGVLALIYLQYHVDDDENLQRFLQFHRPIAEVLSNIRDQFIELANNIEGVRMFYLTPLIEHYLVTDQKNYKWPIDMCAKHVKTDVLSFEKVYKEKQAVQLQTVIRLFPTAKELILNADNWDWSLNSFVKFLQKWHFDYSAVPLKYIKIKFFKQPGKPFVDKLVNFVKDKTDETVTPEMFDTIDFANESICCTEESKNNDDTEDDVKAVEMLEKNKEAKENLGKLLRLGWRFVTPSKLQRVDSFEPPPELPFLLRFMTKASGKDNEKIYYRSYTRKIFAQDSVPEDEDEGEDEVWNEIQENKKSEGIFSEMQSKSKVEIEHNPKNCILTAKICHKISYGNQLVSALKRLKSDEMIMSPGGNYHDNEMVKACECVKVLVLEYKDDPLEQRLRKVFMNVKVTKKNNELENDNSSKEKQVNFLEPLSVNNWETEEKESKNVSVSYDVNYASIFKIFKNVSDVFLRQTEFDVTECNALIKFLKDNEECKFQRIFYKWKDVKPVKKSNTVDEFKEDEEYDYDIDEDDNFKDPLREKLKKIDWDFVDNGQIAVNKKQFNKFTL